jgi:hypothetical protein
MQSKKLLFFVYFFLINLHCFSQTYSIKGIVKDSDNNTLLPFSSIQFMLSKEGGYTDDKGYFEINSYSDKDTLIISYLSYTTKKIPIKNLLKNEINIILLNSKEIALEEVKVSTKKKNTKKIIIGHYDFPTTFVWGSSTGRIFMNYYKNDFQKSVFLKTLYFDFGKIINQRHRTVLRILIKNNDSKTKEPGSNINKKDLIVELSPLSKNLIYDVSSLQIPFPSNGIFVGIEIIGIYENGKLNAMWKHKNPIGAIGVSSTTDENRDKTGAYWTYFRYDNRWTTNFKRGYNTMFKFGIELEEVPN